ncbi:MAG: DoxX family membrane protein [Methanobacteriota archaeon]|nr:MAG: DoxX family membrane protein [Euryarchaeota archaeon]
MRITFPDYTGQQYVAAALRLALGWTFIWAFFDKLLGLGHATASESAWINGGSPTSGFLSYAATGPLAGFYQDLAGSAAVDTLFMLGLLGLGVALILGIGMRVAAVSGAALMLLMWSSRLPPENNPVLDDHIVYMFALILLALIGAGRWLGLGSWWSKQSLVKRFPMLE